MPLVHRTPDLHVSVQECFADIKTTKGTCMDWDRAIDLVYYIPSHFKVAYDSADVLG